MQHHFPTFLNRTVLGASLIVSGFFASNASSVLGQETVVKPTTEPVFRVSRLANLGADSSTDDVTKNEEAVSAKAKAVKVDEPSPVNLTGDSQRIAKAVSLPKPGNASTASAIAPHPLDRALGFAYDSLSQMRNEIYDYTAIMAKRERINGSLSKLSYMDIKIRCPRTDAQGSKVPFSIYMKFLKPKETTGREVLWVEGQNNNKLLAHEGKGLLARRTFHLDPSGMLAMQGQRYPIYDAGIENLIGKLIEKATRDRAAGMCEVNYKEGLKINKRPCSMIELIHDDKRAPYEFHKAQVFIDNELNVPVRYVSYDWPTSPGAAPKVLEEYTYINIRTNVGLSDIDFSTKNPNYNYSK